MTRNAKEIRVTQEDLENGAKLQLRGHLQMNEFDRRVVPSKGLSELVLTPQQVRRSFAHSKDAQLHDMVAFEKARKVLYAHWGFDSKMGSVAIFHGPQGTGKSAAAEALGYQIGKPLKEVNGGEIFSRYVGGTAKNIEALFKEAKE